MVVVLLVSPVPRRTPPAGVLQAAARMRRAAALHRVTGGAPCSLTRSSGLTCLSRGPA